jgi:hypothetical protein
MSIFGFLEIIFFCRTEKSGNITVFCRHTENGKENVRNFLIEKIFFQKNLGAPFFLGYILATFHNIAIM